MSLFAYLFKPKAIPSSRTIARSSTIVCARSSQGDGQNKRSRRRHGSKSTQRVSDIDTLSTHQHIQDFFVQCLVEAGSCQQHQTFKAVTTRRRGYDAPCGSRPTISVRQRRQFSSRPNEKQVVSVAATAERPDISREEYGELANTYPGFGQPLKQRKTKYDTKQTYFPLASRLILTPNQEVHPKHGSRIVLEPEDDDHRQSITRFKALVQRNFGRISQTTLWRRWERLRTPRPRYLDDETLERLFRHLTWVEHKHGPDSMQRFLAVLNECTDEQLPLKVDVWNSAISFAGRWIREVSNQEVKSAVEMWMRMENSNVRADTVTFNILFDIAIKAGRFALADTIFSELKTRNLTPDRYSRAGLIYYAGMRGDGNAVRQAFQEFVNANEIVDTAIMNTVISSLLRAGEAPAAENVFHKMKSLHEKKFGTVAPSSWQEKRELGTLLKQVGARLRRERREHESSFFGAAFSTEERKEELQRISPIAPDAATYRLLIRHHAYISADVQRVHELLGEMKQKNLHIHGSTYYHILRGYRKHGGFAYSAWRLKGLEEVWSEMMAAITQLRPDSAPADDIDHSTDVEQQGPLHTPSIVDPEEDGADQDADSELDRKPYFSTALVFATVQAFYHCAGRHRMIEVQNEILLHWKDITDDERERVQDIVDKCI